VIDFQVRLWDYLLECFKVVGVVLCHDQVVGYFPQKGRGRIFLFL
jgi:hypothetical protein